MFTYVYLNASRGNIFKRFETPGTHVFNVHYSCTATYISGNLVAVDVDGTAVVVGSAETCEDMFDSIANALYWYDKLDGICDKDYVEGFKEYFDLVRACEETTNDSFYEGFVEERTK